MAEGSELRVRRLEVKRQASLFFNLWTINRKILLEIITIYEVQGKGWQWIKVSV